jgi:hypothetical protein
VKVKAHRGEPLNKGVDDVVETGRVMEKEGESLPIVDFPMLGSMCHSHSTLNVSYRNLFP